MAKDVHEIAVELNLGVLKISSKWNPTQEERKAAWELYVELITRISVAPLGKDEGSDREALSSLYELFQSTRKILKSYGPDIAVGGGNAQTTVAYIAIGFLNCGLRPFLSKWHALLEGHEKNRSAETSIVLHEKSWKEHDLFRKELEELRTELSHYANCLADGAGVPRIAEQQKELSQKAVS